MTFLRNKDIFKDIPRPNKKQLVFEEDKDTSSLLDEKQLKK
jgi:hypothetical protein